MVSMITFGEKNGRSRTGKDDGEDKLMPDSLMGLLSGSLARQWNYDDAFRIFDLQFRCDWSERSRQLAQAFG